ncbi:glycosyltransferase [Candidatus Woesearchaeota archaeon]|nr:glycosyltransferase [Candidatus Woesearchaeota archaeon]
MSSPLDVPNIPAQDPHQMTVPADDNLSEVCREKSSCSAEAVPTTLICTFLNEQDTLPGLFESIRCGSALPAEIVFVDGGSTDGSTLIARKFTDEYLQAHLILAPGVNIATGRNIAVHAASFEIIACTDAGCKLSAQWLEEITRPLLTDPAVDVVSGYYLPDAHTLFEKVVGFLTFPSLEGASRPDFVPSGRSIAFRRSAWRIAGGYPEWLDKAEDTWFDLHLQSIGCRFAFAAKAIVRWRPRSDLMDFFKSIQSYSYWDGIVGIFWARRLYYSFFYIICLALAILGSRWMPAWVLLTSLFALHLAWPAFSAARNARSIAAFPIGVAILICRDLASVIGFSQGWLSRRRSARQASLAGFISQASRWQIGRISQGLRPHLEMYKSTATPLVLFALAFLVRLLVILPIEHPNHADHSFYVQVAENLYAGRGFVIDYVWNFHYLPAFTMHPSDYWMPLLSVLILLSFKVFGVSVQAAQLPGVLFGALLVPLTYYISLHEFGSRRQAVFAGALVASQIGFFQVLPDTAPVNSFLVAIALLLVPGYSSLLNTASLGVIVGLAYLTRPDAILVLFIIVVGIVFQRIGSWRFKAGRIVLLLGLCIVTTAPWLIRNYVVFGSAVPFPLTALVGMSNFEDFYSVGVSLRHPSWPSLWTMMSQLNYNLNAIWGLVGWPVFLFIPMSVSRPRQWARTWFWLPWLCLATYVFFYSTLGAGLAEQGSISRSIQSFVPFFAIWASAGLEKFSAELQQVSARLHPRIMFMGLGMLLIVFSIVRSSKVVLESYRSDVELRAKMSFIGRAIDRFQPPESAVVMTRSPWALNYSLRAAAVQIPNNDLMTIYEIASRYHVDYLVLEEGLNDIRPAFASEMWQSQWRVYSGVAPELVASDRSLGIRVYRLAQVRPFSIKKW